MVLNEVAHAHGGNHAVKDERHAADNAGRHGADDGGEFRAEREQDGEHRCNLNDTRVKHLRQRQNTRVLAVSGVGRCAEKRGDRGSQTIAEQRAMQTGVGDVIAIAGGADGGDVANVLDHRSQSDGHDGNDSRHRQAGIHVSAGKQAKNRVLPQDGQANPRRSGHAGEINLAHERRKHIRHKNAHENGDNLNHALTPNVAHDDSGDGDDGNEPVRLAVGDSRASQNEANGDNDGPCHHGREETHDLLCAEDPEQRSQHQVEKARARNAQAGIRQKRGLTVRGDGGIARDKGKRRT